jgi:hypothetical protein
MRMYRTLPPSLLLALLPLAVAAQGNDAAYCASLSVLADRYLVTRMGEGAEMPDRETKAAINDCDRGNTAAAIPTLERKLRDNGFTLPKRP